MQMKNVDKSTACKQHTLTFLRSLYLLCAFLDFS